jgi:hypothetical protein
MKKLLIVAGCAAVVGYLWGFKRGVAVGAAQPTAGPVIGGGTDWLDQGTWA